MRPVAPRSSVLAGSRAGWNCCISAFGWLLGRGNADEVAASEGLIIAVPGLESLVGNLKVVV